MAKIKANGHTIEISHPDKMMFPEKGITKKDMVKFYHKISGYMHPYITNRPMMLHRFPDGINSNDFYQKDVSDYFPSWLKTIEVNLRGKHETQQMINCNQEASLLYVANQASITQHVWLSNKNDLDRPDKLIFDLDPPKENFNLVKEAARDLKKLFNRLEAEVFLMTTGSKGMHIVLPLDGNSNFDTTRDFAKRVAEIIVNEKSDKYTIETRKNKRKGRLFVDYLRNAYGQTSVAPYALRALENAPVATPLHWKELSKKGLSSQSYHYGNIFRRLGALKNPWADYHKNKVNIEKLMKRL